MFHDDQEPLEPEFSQVEPPEYRRDEGFYETGHISPQKHYTGFIAGMLMMFIFCGGLVGGMLLNMHSAALPEETQDTGSRLLEDSFLAAAQPAMTAETKAAQAVFQGSKDSDCLVIEKAPEAVQDMTQEGGLSLQEVYRKVSPSVVSITSSSASGSGIIMSEKGYIITNCHVVSGGSDLRVILEDGRELEAQLVGKDSLSDLAVLHIECEGLTAAEFGDSDSIQVGDAVTAIGDPLGIELRGTMTEGIVSAINRNLTIQGRSLTLIQTTAALNEGNSGGPLINCYGQVIGINTAKIGSVYSSAGVEGLGFAIPINLAKEVVDQLVSLGYVPGRPSLGVETTVLSYEYQMWFGLPEGLYITSVPEGSPAWEAGLRERDVITYVDDQRITCEEDLTAALSTHSAGDSVSIVIFRNRRQYKGSLTLQEAFE